MKDQVLERFKIIALPLWEYVAIIEDGLLLKSKKNITTIEDSL